MRLLTLAVALYAAFMLGRWYAPQYDAPARWTGYSMDSEVPYANGYENGYRDGVAQCGAIPSIHESEMVEVEYANAYER